MTCTPLKRHTPKTSVYYISYLTLCETVLTRPVEITKILLYQKGTGTNWNTISFVICGDTKCHVK